VIIFNLIVVTLLIIAPVYFPFNKRSFVSLHL